MKKLIKGRNKTDKTKNNLLENLAKYPIIQATCERSGISRATFYRWKQEDKEFEKAADKALDEGVKFINDLAESKLIRNIQDGNNTSIIFWLKNRHGKYCERIVHEYEAPREIDKEKQKLIREAFQHAGLEHILKKDDETSEDKQKGTKTE